MDDGLKLFLGIGLIVIVVGVGLIGANRAKNSMEKSGTEIEDEGQAIIDALQW